MFWNGWSCPTYITCDFFKEFVQLVTKWCYLHMGRNQIKSNQLRHNLWKLIQGVTFTGFQNLVRYTKNNCCRDSLPLHSLQGLQQVTLFIKEMMGSRSLITMHSASFAHYKIKLLICKLHVWMSTKFSPGSFIYRGVQIHAYTHNHLLDYWSEDLAT